MIVLDCETSGLDPARCAILSIGAIDFLQPDRQFYVEVQAPEGCCIEPTALAINGFTREEIFSEVRLPLYLALRDLSAWVRLCRHKNLAGSNVAFDAGFLRAAARSIYMPYPFGRMSIDLMSLWYVHRLTTYGELLPSGQVWVKTDEILRYVGLPAEPHPHNALVGAKGEAEAFSRLIYGRGLLPEYEEHRVPEYLRTREVAR